MQYQLMSTQVTSFHITFQCFHAEGDLIPRALTNNLIPDPSPQRVHLIPTAPKEGGQCPDLILPANRD